MEQTMRQPMTTLGGPVGRLGLAALALGGLSAALIAVDSAGAATHAAKTVVVSTAKSAKFGTILVSGKTVYTLKPSKTACTATCLKVWPALVLPKGVTKATAGSGVSASKLGTVTRAGGVRQVDLQRQAPLLVLRGHRSRTGQRQRDRRMGQVDRRGDQEGIGVGLEHGDDRRFGRNRLLARANRDLRSSSWCPSSMPPRLGPLTLRSPRSAGSAGRSRRCASRRLPAGVLDRRRGRGPGGPRLGRPLGGSGFGPSMAGLRVVVIGPLTLAIIGVILVVERVRPAQRRAALRPWLPAGSPLHRVQRHPGRAAW